MDAAAVLYGKLLDRGHPLWELWFLTGLRDGRVGVLLKLHHSVADGMAAVTIMGSLFDFEADAPEPVPGQWAPEPVPGGWSLLAGNFSSKIRTAGRAAAMLTHPPRLVSGARIRIRVARQALGQSSAPRTSLNQVVRPGRRIRFLRLDLAAVKEAAHAHQAKVNDVVLDLWSGGLRQLLLSRAEPTSGVELITNEPVSLRPASGAPTIDNQVGFLALPLPVWEPDVQHRLDLIARTTRMAKSELSQSSAACATLTKAETRARDLLTSHRELLHALSTTARDTTATRLAEADPTRLTAGQAATTAPTGSCDQPRAMFAVRVAAMPSPSSQRAREGTGARCRAAYRMTMLEAYTRPSMVAGSSRAVIPLSPWARTRSPSAPEGMSRQPNTRM